MFYLLPPVINIIAMLVPFLVYTAVMHKRENQENGTNIGYFRFVSSKHYDFKFYVLPFWVAQIAWILLMLIPLRAGGG